MKKCFNDLLGIRVIVSSYEILEKYDLSLFSVADMRNGKANDDGYRGIHLYFQKTNRHYPIEIQINTSRDRQFNDWLHEDLYKYSKSNNIGIKLRELYDMDIIYDQKSFKEMLEDVLFNSKEI